MAEIYTEAQITELTAAIASGVFSVSYTGPPSRTVTFQSLAQMEALLGRMIRDVRAPTSVRFATHSKGFGR